MNFVDRKLLSFSSPASAQAALGATALTAVVSASYNIPRADLSGAPAARFDGLEFAPFGNAATTEIQSEGYTVTRASGDGGASGLNPRADLLWTGAVTMTAAFPRATLDVDRSSPPDLSDIDGAIPGPLPADPAALDLARRTVVLDRLRANAQNPTTVDDAMLDAWLTAAGFGDVSAFLDRAAAAAMPMNQFVLAFVPLPGTTAAASIAFPVSGVFMIRDVLAADFRLADLLAASRSLRAQLDIEGVAPRSGGPELPKGKSALIWVVDETWFDDADWPGGTSGNAAARRADRISRATDWLAPQGIALAPVPA